MIMIRAQQSFGGDNRFKLDDRFDCLDHAHSTTHTVQCLPSPCRFKDGSDSEEEAQGEGKSADAAPPAFPESA
jgi:hypothetical protein